MQAIHGIEFLPLHGCVQFSRVDNLDGLGEFRQGDAQLALFVEDHAVAVEDKLVIAADLIKVYKRHRVFLRVALHQ